MYDNIWTKGEHDNSAGMCLLKCTFHWTVAMFLRMQIALLKLLLAAAPTSKAKTESINILSDVLPEEMPWVRGDVPPQS